MPTRIGSYGVTDDICEERRQVIREEIAILIAHERELRMAEIKVRDEALVSAAREYERRLTDLNHNLRTMLEDRKTFFSRDQHDAFFIEYARFRDETMKHQTVVATWGAAAVFALGIMQLAVHFFLK
jgi:hypothetical protein